MATRQTGARPLGGRDPEPKKRRGLGWLLALLLGLLALAVLLFFVLRDDDQDGGGNSGKDQTTQQAPAQSGGAQAGGAAGGGGVLTAGGQAILPLPSGGLAPYAGKAVTGNAVPVQAVIADEAFWVGTSRTDRVLVHLRRQGESPFQVEVGEKVRIVGTVQPLRPGDADRFGVTAAEGADQLASQGHYVEATELGSG